MGMAIINSAHSAQFDSRSGNTVFCCFNIFIGIYKIDKKHTYIQKIQKTTRNNGNTGKKYSWTENVLLMFSYFAIGKDLLINWNTSCACKAFIGT